MTVMESALSYKRCSRTRSHCLYGLPLPHPQGAFRPSVRFPVVRGRGRSAAGCPTGGGAPRGRGRRLDIPGHLRHKPAARCIGLCQLLLLRFGQLPAHIFDGTAQFKKAVMGQGALPSRIGRASKVWANTSSARTSPYSTRHWPRAPASAGVWPGGQHQCARRGGPLAITPASRSRKASWGSRHTPRDSSRGRARRAGATRWPPAGRAGRARLPGRGSGAAPGPPAHLQGHPGG